MAVRLAPNTWLDRYFVVFTTKDTSVIWAESQLKVIRRAWWLLASLRTTLSCCGTLRPEPFIGNTIQGQRFRQIS
jgi:hypothetical protein